MLTSLLSYRLMENHVQGDHNEVSGFVPHYLSIVGHTEIINSRNHLYHPNDMCTRHMYSTHLSSSHCLAYGRPCKSGKGCAGLIGVWSPERGRYAFYFWSPILKSLMETAPKVFGELSQATTLELQSSTLASSLFGSTHPRYTGTR